MHRRDLASASASALVAMLAPLAGRGVTVDVPARPPTASTSAEPGPIEQGRQRIDRLDQQVIELIRQRNQVSAQVQRLRLAGGGGRVDTGREQRIISRYRDTFGEPGVQLAQAILTAARG